MEGSPVQPLPGPVVGEEQRLFGGAVQTQDLPSGKDPSSIYSPDKLDVDQWVSVARDAGAKYAAPCPFSPRGDIVPGGLRGASPAMIDNRWHLIGQSCGS
jgi:hypothetical protein